TQLGATFVGLQVVGICTTAALVSISIFIYFRRNPTSAPNLFTRAVAPISATIVLVIACGAVLTNFGDIAGNDSGFIAALPLLLLVAFLVGLGVPTFSRSGKSLRRDEV